jgi:threonine/homoserine/homoserine lactone efflux protein
MLLPFIAAALALLIMPGPAVMYIVTRSATQGRAAGIASVLGIASGGLVHVIASVAGLSLLIARSAVAVQYLRIGGAIYLAWLGVQKLREATAETSAETPALAPRSNWQIYRDGVIVNVLNPKTALFFVAFLPQFVDAGRPVTPQLLLLGMTFITLAVITDACWAIAAATVSSRLAKRRTIGTRLSAYAAAAVYFGLAATAMVTNRRAS